MRASTKKAIDRLKRAQARYHDANSVLTEDLSGDIEELTSKRDVEGLEKLMDGLPECFLRYSIFQEIERLSVSKFARKKR
jgi:DNA-directed RNA polymerase specialized sigma24 family protein